MEKSNSNVVTIFDVAERAGVSYSTVSRVVNNYAYVKPATRTKVQTAMDELGYVANLKARSLAGGRSQIIGILTYDLDTTYNVEVVRGIDEEVSTRDYDMILSTTHHRRQKEANHVAKLAKGLVDGLLIVLPSNLDAYVATLRNQGFPFVLIDHEGMRMRATDRFRRPTTKAATTRSATCSIWAIGASASSPARSANRRRSVVQPTVWPAIAPHCRMPVLPMTRIWSMKVISSPIQAATAFNG